MPNIDIIVRGIIKKRNKILLCKHKNKDYYFLPGGHIEYGETLIERLKRELKEELNLKIKNYKFLGIIENFFSQNNKKVQKINFLFFLKTDNKISLREKHLEFHWLNIKEIDQVKILPPEVKTIIKNC